MFFFSLPFSAELDSVACSLLPLCSCFLSITTFLQLDLNFAYMAGPRARVSVVRHMIHFVPSNFAGCWLLVFLFRFYFPSRLHSVKIICPCQIRDTYFSIEKLPSKWVNEWMKRANEQKKNANCYEQFRTFFHHRISRENEMEGESGAAHIHNMQMNTTRNGSGHKNSKINH